MPRVYMAWIDFILWYWGLINDGFSDTVVSGFSKPGWEGPGAFSRWDGAPALPNTAYLEKDAKPQNHEAVVTSAALTTNGILHLTPDRVAMAPEDCVDPTALTAQPPSSSPEFSCLVKCTERFQPASFGMSQISVKPVNRPRLGIDLILPLEKPVPFVS